MQNSKNESVFIKFNLKLYSYVCVNIILISMFEYRQDTVVTSAKNS